MQRIILLYRRIIHEDAHWPLPYALPVMTKLDKPLRREVEINGEPHVVVISPQGLKLTVKGKRLGHEISWQDLVRGNAALATAPNASVDATDE